MKNSINSIIGEWKNDKGLFIIIWYDQNLRTSNLGVERLYYQQQLLNLNLLLKNKIMQEKKILLSNLSTKFLRFMHSCDHLLLDCPLKNLPNIKMGMIKENIQLEGLKYTFCWLKYQS